MSSFPTHPAAELFPLMGDEEYEGLVESIRANGLREPIVLLDGLILDGRHRARACADTGVEPRYVEAEMNGDGPVEYVIDKNLHRRTLTPSQRATTAAKAIEPLAAEAKERQREAGRLYGVKHPKSKVEVKSPPPLRSRERAARRFQVADAQVGGAIALQKRAPELFKKVESGEKTISAALREAGLSRSGATAATMRPRDKHKAVIVVAENLARLNGKWERSMTDALAPPQARKQLTVLRKAAVLLAEVIDAVEYRADTPHTFLGR